MSRKMLLDTPFEDIAQTIQIFNSQNEREVTAEKAKVL